MPKEIQARHVKHGGKLRWRVIVPRALNGGKPRRKYFKSQRDAENFALQQNKLTGKVGARLLSLRSEVQVLLMQLVEEMGDDISQCVEAGRRWRATKAVESAPLESVIGECMAEKRKLGLSPKHIAGMESVLEMFAVGRETVAISAVTQKDISAFLDRLTNPASRRSQLINIRTLFSFARKRGYLLTDQAALVELPTLGELQPEALTVAQARHVLFWTATKEPDCLLAVVLVLFGGVRPEEASLLPPAMIKLDQNIIDIPADISKTGRRRFAQINDTLKAWLPIAIPKARSPLPEWRMRKVRQYVKPWPHDALRHSFVTYHHAIFGDIETSTKAGHSVSIMNKHYLALTTHADALSFWQLKPEIVLGEGKPAAHLE